MTFIDAHREKFGVEPICAVLPNAPSRYYELKARARDPSAGRSELGHDQWLGEHIGRVWREHHAVYGVRKVWKQLAREGYVVARGTVARLMRRLGLAGAVRGRKFRAASFAWRGQKAEAAAAVAELLKVRPGSRSRPWRAVLRQSTFCKEFRRIVKRARKGLPER